MEVAEAITLGSIQVLHSSENVPIIEENYERDTQCAKRIKGQCGFRRDGRILGMELLNTKLTLIIST